MDIKLTLSIEESMIAKAKRYAKKKGLSLSALVESFFGAIKSERAHFNFR